MVKAVGFNCCKVSLVSTSTQYLNTMIIYMVIIINVFIFQPLILSLFGRWISVTCWYSIRYKSVRWRLAAAIYHWSNTKGSQRIWSGGWVNGRLLGICSLCVHRLRRVDTGLRNTDITNAHGLVIHGFRPFIYLILCAFGTDLKGFWRASSPRC